jgi:hypothetical protein
MCNVSFAAGDMVDSDADDDDAPGADGLGLFDEGLVPLLMGLPGDLQTSASMLYDDDVRDIVALCCAVCWPWDACARCSHAPSHHRQQQSLVRQQRLQQMHTHSRLRAHSHHVPSWRSIVYASAVSAGAGPAGVACNLRCSEELRWRCTVGSEGG